MGYVGLCRSQGAGISGFAMVKGEALVQIWRTETIWQRYTVEDYPTGFIPRLAFQHLIYIRPSQVAGQTPTHPLPFRERGQKFPRSWNTKTPWPSGILRRQNGRDRHTMQWRLDLDATIQQELVEETAQARRRP